MAIKDLAVLGIYSDDELQGIVVKNGSIKTYVVKEAGFEDHRRLMSLQDTETIKNDKAKTQQP